MYKVVYFDHVDGDDSREFSRFMNFSDESFSDLDKAVEYVNVIRFYSDFVFIVEVSDYEMNTYKVIKSF